MRTKTQQALRATFSVALAFTLAACGGSGTSEGTTAEGDTAATTAAATGDGTDAKGEGVMTYAEYDAAAADDAVTIEAFVQGKQVWLEHSATLYLQDADGGYFVYGADCSKDDYDKLVDGQKVKVSGYKTEWSGETEITDAKLEVEEGSFIAPATDVTDLLGTDELIKHQNQKVAFTDMTIAPSKDPSGAEVAFLFNYDGSGTEGDDLYFNVEKDGSTYSFTVESDLCDKDSDVYKAVQDLKVGDTVDLEGFLYWYEGANPHITSVTVK